MYDFCVIGAGMVGSSAAKYLSEIAADRVVLIGTKEPNREDYNNHDVFGAHYDEGRITRNLHDNELWGQLAMESIKRYRDIENMSGIKFFTENGYLLIADQNSKEIIESQQYAEKFQIPVETIPTTKGIQTLFPFLAPLQNMSGILERQNAGTINPRKLVQAQLELFRQNRGHFICDCAIGLTQNHKDASWSIRTSKSGQIQAKKVLICPGAFMYHLEDAPEVLGKINMQPRTGLAARIRIDNIALRDKLVDRMPSILFRSKNEYESHPSVKGIKDEGLAFYMLAPVPYPDGHWYLKLGMSCHCYFKTAREITHWFRHGSYSDTAIKIREVLKKTAQSFIPELDISHTVLDTCSITVTPNEHPYIDRAGQNLYVGCGGNGWAAKSCDELGRLAAEVTMQNQDHKSQSSTIGSSDMSDFKCQYLGNEWDPSRKQVSKI